MCLIINAGALPEFAKRKDSNKYKPIHKFVLAKKAFLVSGGTKYVDELKRTSAIDIYNEYESAGLVTPIPRDEVDAKEKELIDNNSCISDDEHIIALAQLSGSRTLIMQIDTNTQRCADPDLTTDFANRNLISNPRGFVCCRAAHVRDRLHHFECDAVTCERSDECTHRTRRRG